jgi:hypothetical protein
VIRQAISCDICGTEKKQTNHWFVAYDQGGELRVSGWNSRNRLRPGSKHLCGQTCLHKLVDEFMARTLASRARPATEEAAVEEQVAATDTSLTSDAAYGEFESSARLLSPPIPIAPSRPPSRPAIEMIAVTPKPPADAPAAPLADEPPSFASRNWRAEAWKREREREMRANGRHPAVPVRRRSIS